MNVPFTQYLRPNGREVSLNISVPSKHRDRVEAILAAGYTFGVEMLSRGNEISLTISDDDTDWVCLVVPNGPLILPTIEELIESFPDHLLKQ